MKIAVVPNPAKREAMNCVKEVTALLKEHGCQVLLESGLFGEHGFFCGSAGKELSSCDVLIAIGGDGTIIHTAKLAASLDKPVLGINAGTLGFTAGLERDELFLLPKLLDGNYREERRLMVSVQVLSKGELHSFLALNDAVVSGESAKITNYSMALGEGRAYRCRADGFIVATPTGSTAYSLSAGGPVIQPDTSCLVYTPICPHSLFNRSVVFAGDTRLTVTIPENTARVFLTVDGEEPLPLHTGNRLIFSRSERTARFLMLGRKNFYDRLNEKIIETR